MTACLLPLADAEPQCSQLVCTSAQTLLCRLVLNLSSYSRQLPYTTLPLNPRFGVNWAFSLLVSLNNDFQGTTGFYSQPKHLCSKKTPSVIVLVIGLVRRFLFWKQPKAFNVETACCFLSFHQHTASSAAYCSNVSFPGLLLQDICSLPQMLKENPTEQTDRPRCTKIWTLLHRTDTQITQSPSAESQ